MLKDPYEKKLLLCLLLLGALLLLSLPSYADVVLTEEEFNQVMISLEQSETELIQQKETIMSLLNQQNQLGQIIQTLSVQSEQQKEFYKMQNKEIKNLQISFYIAVGVIGLMSAALLFK